MPDEHNCRLYVKEFLGEHYCTLSEKDCEHKDFGNVLPNAPMYSAEKGHTREDLPACTLVSRIKEAEKGLKPEVEPRASRACR